MTHVEKSQVKREVRTVRGQALIVTLAPEGIWIREKGRRTAYLSLYGSVYQRAVEVEVSRVAREKKAKRKAARRVI